MKYKAILFDFDGLMFDTESVWQSYFFKANEVFKTNFTEEDRIPLPMIQSATMIIAIESGLLLNEQGSCNVRAYTDQTNRFFIQEFEEVNIKSPEQQVQIQPKSPLTRVKQKTRLSDAFKKIINPTKKDVEQ